jgi:hypothetical protein
LLVFFLFPSSFCICHAHDLLQIPQLSSSQEFDVDGVGDNDRRFSVCGVGGILPNRNSVEGRPDGMGRRYGRRYEGEGSGDGGDGGGGGYGDGDPGFMGMVAAAQAAQEAAASAGIDVGGYTEGIQGAIGSAHGWASDKLSFASDWAANQV